MRTAIQCAGALVLALTPLGAVHAQQPKQTIMPEDAGAGAFQQAVGYSDAVIHGDTIILSGVIAAPKEGEEDMAPAFTRAFDQIGRTLQRAGAGWDDVIEMQTFHTDLTKQIMAFVDVKNRYIKAPFPAWTAIGVSSLYEPAGLVEIKVTARLRPAAE